LKYSAFLILLWNDFVSYSIRTVKVKCVHAT